METNKGKSLKKIALIYKEREIISKEAGNKKKQSFLTTSLDVTQPESPYYHDRL